MLTERETFRWDGMNKNQVCAFGIHSFLISLGGRMGRCNGKLAGVADGVKRLDRLMQKL